MNEIAAIETSYRGFRFRSRTEARWAVFFDGLGVRFEYEKEGFRLPSGSYLPDFWLDGIGWLEVKGASPTKKERDLASELAQFSGRAVYVATGAPDDDHPCIIHTCGGDYWDAGLRLRDLGWCKGDRLSSAVTAAKSARFEHGESGAQQPGAPRGRSYEKLISAASRHWRRE